MEYVDYGYCRISTPKQNIDRQERNILAAYPSAIIIKETFTGTKLGGRKDWNRLYKHILQQSKTKKVRIIFDAVARLSRNADEGCELYEELFYKDITLVFLKENHINTDVYKQALQTQITEKINTNNKLTDDLINSIIDALNTFTMNLAKAQIRLAFEDAEKEVVRLHKRTSEGLLTAKLNGKQIGRITGKKYTTKKEKIAKQIILKNSKDFYGTNTDPEVIKLADISRNTFYKYKAELKERADD
ncbi:MAG: recombinase family protein [Clostridiales bacterium]|nr:recombinase family protein [Clostridiales bacterium]